jgi:cytochrome P450
MCVGANLARKELDVAFRVLLERLDNFELACAESELHYPPNVLLRGIASLPIRFTARTA